MEQAETLREIVFWIQVGYLGIVAIGALIIALCWALDDWPHARRSPVVAAAGTE